jgi:hypothetical protein
MKAIYHEIEFYQPKYDIFSKNIFTGRRILGETGQDSPVFPSPLPLCINMTRFSRPSGDTGAL